MTLYYRTKTHLIGSDTLYVGSKKITCQSPSLMKFSSRKKVINTYFSYFISQKKSPLFYSDGFSKIAEEYPDPATNLPQSGKFSHTLVRTDIEQLSIMEIVRKGTKETGRNFSMRTLCLEPSSDWSGQSRGC